MPISRKDSREKIFEAVPCLASIILYKFFWFRDLLSVGDYASQPVSFLFTTENRVTPKGLTARFRCYESLNMKRADVDR